MKNDEVKMLPSIGMQTLSWHSVSSSIRSRDLKVYVQ